MFLLDTNVVSELRKATTGRLNINVAAWAGPIPATNLFISAITIVELEVGVRIMERRDPAQGIALRKWFDGDVLPSFAERVLSVDAKIALRCGGLHVPNRRPYHDALIAATAVVHGLTVVTRNVADFADTGVRVLDPWHDPAA